MQESLVFESDERPAFVNLSQIHCYSTMMPMRKITYHLSYHAEVPSSSVEDNLLKDLMIAKNVLTKKNQQKQWNKRWKALRDTHSREQANNPNSEMTKPTSLTFIFMQTITNISEI